MYNNRHNNMYSRRYSMLDNIVDAAFVNIANKTIMEMGYTPGDPVDPVLTKIIETYLGISSIKELWGPLWALPVTIMADRIHPSLNYETRMTAIVYVVGQMEGRTSITPNVISGRGSDPAFDPMRTSDNNTMSKIKSYISTATRVCKFLDIPSPMETTLLYKSLDKGVSPSEAETVWRSGSKKNKLSPQVVDACVDNLFDILWPDTGLPDAFDDETEKARNFVL